MKWTSEQEKAINAQGNIIVSAGAGSGKTAVLTQRVIEKLLSGISINKLIVLTFTNAAADEMKKRIKEKIKENKTIIGQLNLVDTSYITTFDSFALSLVKKYNYVLNLPQDISIIDDAVLKISKKKILDEIFNRSYKKTNFKNLIDLFSSKDDENIKAVIDFYNTKLETLANKKQYLEEYMEVHFKKTFIDQMFNSYLELINKTKNNMFNELNKIKALASNKKVLEFILNVEKTIEFLNKNEYSEYQELAKIKLVFPRNVEDNNLEEIKNSFAAFNDYKKQIEELVKDDEETLKKEILLTKENINAIIELLIEYDKKVFEYKLNNNSFEFNDIMRFGIRILEENDEIRNSIKNYYNEIMVDEYQDTSDIQEYFINLIGMNNLYMVGDIKQSIYRFRNANPTIFKNTYQKFSENGICVDLNKNFRSRKEVIENINLIFSNIMNNTFGGVEYDSTQQLEFGNNLYEEKKEANMEIYTYQEDKNYKKEEIEAFIMADDIISKLNKFEIYDSNLKTLRPVKYSDFCILIDRKTDFDLIKQVFEYKKIPLNVFKDEKFVTTNEIYVVRSILKLINIVREKDYTDLKHTFFSLARSYVLEIDDDTLYKNADNILTCQEFKDIFLKIEHLKDISLNSSLSVLMNEIYETFDLYNKTIKIGDVNLRNTKLTYLIEVSRNLEKIGYTLKEFVSYFDYIIENKIDINFNVNKDFSKNAVNIMSIHGAKGLEFSICYFPLLFKKFNIEDIKDSFLFDKQIGLIIPNFIEGIKDTFYKSLMKNNYLTEEISEKIRLFYVALTRSKEKMIFITNMEENDIPKETYRSFKDILFSIKKKLGLYLVDKDYTVDKKYKLINDQKYEEELVKTNIKYEYETINIEKENIDRVEYASKILQTTNDSILKEGTIIHEVLEYLDFKNYEADLENYTISEAYKNKIKEFFKQPFMKDINTSKIYKELEIDSGSGIIDLVIENDKLIVIDYKLSEIEKKEYQKQVEKYMEYLKTISNKEIEGYIYSILECRYKKV